MYYDYEEYWVKTGKKPNPRITPALEAQTNALVPVLDKLDFKTVLEYGAGWGRVTNLIKERYAPTFYTAVDLSRERLNQINGVNRVVADITEDNHFMRHDLVIATEVLLHVTPDRIEQTIENMKRTTNKYIVTLDYYPKEKVDRLAEHNFVHDYPKIYKNAEEIRINDIHSIFVWER